MLASARALRLARGKHAKMLFATLVSLGLASSASLAQDLPMEKTLPLALAVEAVQAALATCVQQGDRVSVAVVDRGTRARPYPRRWCRPAYPG